MCVRARLFQELLLSSELLFEKEKKKFLTKNLYIILSFIFIVVVVVVVVTFVSPQSRSFSLLDAEKKGPSSPFRRRRRTPPRLRPKQSSFGSKERDFECFVVWFSLSTSSIQNSGANKKSYTYSIVLEKGPLDTHHGASFLGPRTVDAI